MNILRNFLIVVGMLTAAILFATEGAASLAFQMSFAFLALYIVKPYLPTPTHGLTGLAGCDGDPSEVLQQVTKDLADAKTLLTKQQTELKDAHREVMSAMAALKPLEGVTKENIDKAITAANEQGETVKELAQKLDDVKKAVKEGPTKPETFRSLMLKEIEANKDKYEAVKNREGRSLRLVMKEITTTEAGGVTGGGLMSQPYRDSMVSFERDAVRIRSLLSVIPVTSASVEYAKQTVRTNAARIVAEGTPKPYSQYAWGDATANIVTIAHLAKMTLQAIADAPRLVAEVESEMRYGLAYAEDAELLNGDGTTGHVSGLIDNATAYAVPSGVTATNILTPVDILRVAILQAHLALAAPDGHILNPIDVANIELLRRDPDKGGGYLFGNPDSAAPVMRLWRLPVVETAAMAVGDFLTGAFKYAASLYDRQEVQVLISTENDDDFEKNKATMRCESRVGLGVRRPYALITGSFANGS